MKVAIAGLALCVLVGGCVTQPPRSTFKDGRLANSAFVEIIAEREQLASVRSQALAKGWTVDCEGQLGDFSTLRIGLPAGVAQEAVENEFGAHAFFAQKWQKVVFIYDGMKKTRRGCASY